MLGLAQRLEKANILAIYASAERRLLLFDYDGTLTPIVADPAAAILSPEALQAIQTLAADPRNAVWIISGRDQSFLEQRFGHLIKLGLVAEHGSFMRSPGSTDWEDLTHQIDPAWQLAVIKVFQRYTDMTGGSRIERKRASVVWHFRQASQDYATLQAAECKKDLKSLFGRSTPVEFIDGKCVLEARLKIINKGQTTQRIVEKIRALSGKSPDFVLCFGDDVTDEGISDASFATPYALIQFQTCFVRSVSVLYPTIRYSQLL